MKEANMFINYNRRKEYILLDKLEFFSVTLDNNQNYQQKKNILDIYNPNFINLDIFPNTDDIEDNIFPISNIFIKNMFYSILDGYDTTFDEIEQYNKNLFFGRLTQNEDCYIFTINKSEEQETIYSPRLFTTRYNITPNHAIFGYRLISDFDINQAEILSTKNNYNNSTKKWHMDIQKDTEYYIELVLNNKNIGSITNPIYKDELSVFINGELVYNGLGYSGNEIITPNISYLAEPNNYNKTIKIRDIYTKMGITYVIDGQPNFQELLGPIRIIPLYLDKNYIELNQNVNFYLNGNKTNISNSDIVNNLNGYSKYDNDKIKGLLLNKNNTIKLKTLPYLHGNNVLTICYHTWVYNIYSSYIKGYRSLDTYIKINNKLTLIYIKNSNIYNNKHSYTCFKLIDSYSHIPNYNVSNEYLGLPDSFNKLELELGILKNY